MYQKENYFYNKIPNFNVCLALVKKEKLSAKITANNKTFVDEKTFFRACERNILALGFSANLHTQPINKVPSKGRKKERKSF